jgi:hypothetical protein
MKKLLLCIVTVAALACMSGVALGGKTYSAEAFIQNGNGECGANEPSDAVVGVVTFHRTGNVVRFAIDVEHGTPDSSYNAELWQSYPPAACVPLFSDDDAFTTNNRGEGHFTGEVEVEEDATTFFGDTFGGPARGGDTPIVTLP